MEPIAVFAPSVFVTISIEPSTGGGDDIHVHAGGQGIWIARMLRQFDCAPTVCAPVGGEAGQTFLGLTEAWEIGLADVPTSATTPAYVVDRRGGERRELARSELPVLYRHEVDDLYNRILELALGAGTCVVTGPTGPEQLPDDFYRRLGADLAAAGVDVIADLHGPELGAFLEGGPIRALKVSEGDLVEDGALTADDEGRVEDAQVGDAIDRLRGLGVASVVVSRGDQPALTSGGDGYQVVGGPRLSVVDPAGSGDSMTAALASGQLEGLDWEPTLRRAWAAGAANITRHGLGSGNRALIDRLADQVELRSWERADD